MLENIIISFSIGLISSFIISELIWLINKLINKYHNWQCKKAKIEFNKEVEKYYEEMNYNKL